MVSEERIGKMLNTEWLPYFLLRNYEGNQTEKYKFPIKPTVSLTLLSHYHLLSLLYSLPCCVLLLL